MAFTITDRGFTEIAAGTSGVTTLDSATWTPAVGALIVAIPTHEGRHVGSTVTFSMTDTFPGTTGWVESAQANKTGTPNYGRRTSIYTTVITSTGSGKVTVTRAPSGSVDQYTIMQVFEITGQVFSPPITGVTGSQYDPGAPGTTCTVTLTGTPRSTSLVLGAMSTDSAISAAATQPTGWTEIFDRFDASFQVELEVSYKNGNASSTAQWTNLPNDNHLAAAVEIFAAEFGFDQRTLNPPGLLSPRGRLTPIGDPTVAAGSTITGTVAVTLANFTSSATGTETTTGTVAVTLENFTANGVGTETITGTSAVTLANFTSSATGTETITGTVARTLQNLTSAATGTEVFTGTSARTLANFTGAASGTVSAVAAVGLFPTTVSANGRYIKDQNGDPWMMHGEAAWSLAVGVSLEDAATYLDDRSSRGVNAILVNAIEKKIGANAPNNFYNQYPFSGTALQSTLNEAYWQHLDAIIQHAATKGITVILFVAYLNFNHGTGGWWSELAAASNAQVQTYGGYLGTRYKDYSNVIWCVGGDYDSTATEKDRYDHIMVGIQATGDTHLATAHNVQNSDSTAIFDSYSWLSLNAIYAYDPNAISVSATGYGRSTVRPTFFIEGRYDNYSGGAYTLAEVRRGQWQTVLVGGLGGHVVGNEDIWPFGYNTGYGGDYDWASALSDSSITHSHQIKVLMDALTSTRWTGLAPDLTDTFLTSGESSGATQAAASFSTHCGLVYVATTGSITVDLTEISGHATVLCRWFDPTSGDYTSLGTISTSSSHVFTHPGANDAGDNDWVLLMEGTQDATGTVAVTLQNFTGAASGTETITGTSAVTLQNFTSSASGLADIVGTSATTLANFTGSASGTETITGTVAVTLQNFTSSASGLADIIGTSAVTLQNFTSSATGTETITGTSATTLQNFTASASGLADITGTVARTLANFTGAASGSVTNPGSNGAAVLQDFVGAATGSVVFTGTAAVTLQNFTSAASGTETISGTVAVTLANFTSTASGTETITGTVAVTLAPVVAAAAGSESITGTAARTLQNFTGAATGTVTVSGGSAAVTLQNFTSTATGVVTNPPGGLGDRLPFDDNLVVIIGGSGTASAIIGVLRRGVTVTGDDDTVLIIDRQAQLHTTFDEWTVLMP